MAKRGLDWSSSDMEAKLSELDVSIAVNPGNPFHYPMIFILLSASSIDVSLRWSALPRSWKDQDNVDLLQWYFESDVDCSWKPAEDSENEYRNVWKIKITKDYSGVPTLPSLGVVIGNPPWSYSVSAFFLLYALARERVLILEFLSSAREFRRFYGSQ
jgi:hypothetical protein